MTKKANKSLESVQTHKQLSNKNKVNQQEGETRKNRARTETTEKGQNFKPFYTYEPNFMT